MSPLVHLDLLHLLPRSRPLPGHTFLQVAACFALLVLVPALPGAPAGGLLSSLGDALPFSAVPGGSALRLLIAFGCHVVILLIKIIRMLNLKIYYCSKYFYC